MEAKGPPEEDALGRSLDTASMHPEEEMRVSWQPLALQSEEAWDPVHFLDHEAARGGSQEGERAEGHCGVRDLW